MKDEKAFTERINQVLNEQVDQLDDETSRRLKQARMQAVELVDHKHKQNWKPVIAFAFSILLGLAIILWPKLDGFNEISSPIEDLDLLVADDSLQLYEELEFYQWLLVDETEAG